MSPKLLCVVLAAALLATVGVLAVSPTVATSSVANADGDSPLDKGMEKLNKGFRSLRRAGSDFGKVLEYASSMQEGALLAKAEMPHTIEELEEKARPAALKKYRLTMIALIEELLVLEKAALAEDADKVKASIQKLRGLQQSGHKEFKDDEEDEGGRGGRRGGRGGRGG